MSIWIVVLVGLFRHRSDEFSFNYYMAQILLFCLFLCPLLAGFKARLKRQRGNQEDQNQAPRVIAADQVTISSHQSRSDDAVKIRWLGFIVKVI